MSAFVKNNPLYRLLSGKDGNKAEKTVGDPVGPNVIQVELQESNFALPGVPSRLPSDSKGGEVGSSDPESAEATRSLEEGLEHAAENPVLLRTYTYGIAKDLYKSQEETKLLKAQVEMLTEQLRAGSCSPTRAESAELTAQHTYTAYLERRAQEAAAEARAASLKLTDSQRHLAVVQDELASLRSANSDRDFEVDMRIQQISAALDSERSDFAEKKTQLDAALHEAEVQRHAEARQSAVLRTTVEELQHEVNAAAEAGEGAGTAAAERLAEERRKHSEELAEVRRRQAEELEAVRGAGEAAQRELQEHLDARWVRQVADLQAQLQQARNDAAEASQQAESATKRLDKALKDNHSSSQALATANKRASGMKQDMAALRKALDAKTIDAANAAQQAAELEAALQAEIAARTEGAQGGGEGGGGGLLGTLTRMASGKGGAKETAGDPQPAAEGSRFCASCQQAKDEREEELVAVHLILILRYWASKCKDMNIFFERL